jgi:hypothetical protein
MHRWVLATGVLLALAAPASATVNVYATIDKFKDITVTEHIIINKQIQVIARVVSNPTSVAEASAIINQENSNNRACENCAEKLDTIENSITSNSGIVVTNQSAGNNNNQGSSIAIAVDFGGGGAPPPTPSTDYSFANAQASVEQQNGQPYYPVIGVPLVDLVPPTDQVCCELGNYIDAVNLVFRDALITGSINENTGVVHVNQATGNNNNQANGLAIAVGLRPGGGVAIAEADLGQFNTCNTVLESNDAGASGDLQVGINKDATITGSVNDNTGVIGVNQTVGNMANQANVVALAAATVQ